MSIYEEKETQQQLCLTVTPDFFFLYMVKHNLCTGKGTCFCKKYKQMFPIMNYNERHSTYYRLETATINLQSLPRKQKRNRKSHD